MSTEATDLVAGLSYAELRRWAKHFGVKGRRKAFKLRDSLQPFAGQIAEAMAAESAQDDVADAVKAAPKVVEEDSTSARRRGYEKRKLPVRRAAGRKRQRQSPSPEAEADDKAVPDFSSGKTGNSPSVTKENLTAKSSDKIQLSADKIQKSTDKIQKSTDKIQKSTDKIQKLTDKSQESADKIELTTDKIELTTDKIELIADESQESADKIEKSADKIQKSTDKIHETADKIQKSTDKNQESTDEIELTANKILESAEKIPKTTDKIHKTADKIQELADEIELTADKIQKSADESQLTTDSVDLTTDKNKVSSDRIKQLPDKNRNQQFDAVAVTAENDAASSCLTDDSLDRPSLQAAGEDSQKENVAPSDYSPGQVSQHSAQSCFYVVEDEQPGMAAPKPAAAARPAAAVGMPNFADIHARNAARHQESLADYQARKAARATYLLSKPVTSQARLHTHQVTSTPQGRSAVTQTSPSPPQSQHRQARQPPQSASPAVRQHVCRQAFTPGSGSKRQKFDLQSSLSRPLTWVPHRGPLKPFAPESPAYLSGSGGSGCVGRKRPISAKEAAADSASAAKRKHLDLP
ncbi:hypothetical protein BOX15_Mlig020680g1 [Macrostomum lignano]|uniref:Uncharacterized protein n=1 Tax=Macrostomum lignano TaxID=282301 RepID=A0A267GD47_9PLAT|nr:hypothetical protein BOX15_Mlig020680g1 [Macrostomum lignano]